MIGAEVGGVTRFMLSHHESKTGKPTDPPPLAPPSCKMGGARPSKLVYNPDMEKTHWSVILKDGSVLQQANGYTYGSLPREQIESFQLWLGDTLLVELKIDESHPVESLRYRRRVVADDGGLRETFVVLGWDAGPAYVFDCEGRLVRFAAQFDNDDILLRKPEPITKLGES